MLDKIKVDFEALDIGIQGLRKLLVRNIESYFNLPQTDSETHPIPPETLEYFIQTLALDAEQGQSFKEEPALYYAVLIALMPHLDPHFFDSIIQATIQKPVDFKQIGGVRGTRYVFIPTLETLYFVCSVSSLKRRLEIQRLFEEDGLLNYKDLVRLDLSNPEEPLSTAKIIMNPSFVELFTLGEQLPPVLSTNFPAKRINTKLKLEDLVLENDTIKQVLEVENWIKYGKVLEKDKQLGKHIKKGYRILFFGPPGTGKTVTAGVIGRRNNKKVYAIDLSMVVSKYIGETEKNLANLLDKAENQDWILFFDEADALFGKRSNVKDAHDRFANQEVAYLLQRIEDFNGLVIMATNMKKNIDEAFLRRFQMTVNFPFPNYNERKKLWKKILPASIPLSEEIVIEELSRKYSLSGASIVNVVHYCCLQALKRQNNGSNGARKEPAMLNHEDFIVAIKRELAKAGKGV